MLTPYRQEELRPLSRPIRRQNAEKIIARLEREMRILIERAPIEANEQDRAEALRAMQIARNHLGYLYR